MSKYYPLPDEVKAEKQNELSQKQLREIYPQDSNLLYVQCYMKKFEPATLNEDTLDLKKIINFCRTRRDAPAFVRKLLGFYIDSTGHVATQPLVLVREQELSNHGDNIHELQIFKAKYPEQYVLALQTIYEHYELELSGEIVNRLKHEKKEISVLEGEPEPEPQGLVMWYDKLSMKRHYNEISSPREDRAPQKSYIKKILDCDDKKPKVSIKDESIFDKMEEDFPNFKAVIKFYKAQFRLSEEINKYRVNPILMVGSAGIGKTQFIKRLAKDLGTWMEYLDLSASSGGWLLNGLNPSWSNAKAGKVAEAIIKGPTINPIVVLDEIEKSGKNKMHDPLAPLYSLLEENTAKEFSDEFVDHPIDASGVIYIACANSLDGIPEPLMTRMKVFNVPDPTLDEKRIICQRIYEQCTEQALLFNQTLDSEILEILLDKSLREAKQILSDAVANSLLEFSKDELRTMKIKGEVIRVEKRHTSIAEHKTKQKFGF